MSSQTDATASVIKIQEEAKQLVINWNDPSIPDADKDELKMTYKPIIWGIELIRRHLDVVEEEVKRQMYEAFRREVE